MQNYTASTNNTGGINVEFFNDASGRDVQVDYIQVNGQTRQAEQQSTNTGSWNSSANSCGGVQSDGGAHHPKTHDTDGFNLFHHPS